MFNKLKIQIVFVAMFNSTIYIVVEPIISYYNIKSSTNLNRINFLIVNFLNN